MGCLYDLLDVLYHLLGLNLARTPSYNQGCIIGIMNYQHKQKELEEKTLERAITLAKDTGYPGQSTDPNILFKDENFLLTLFGEWCEFCDGQGGVHVCDHDYGIPMSTCPWCQGTGVTQMPTRGGISYEFLEKYLDIVDKEGSEVLAHLKARLAKKKTRQ